MEKDSIKMNNVYIGRTIGDLVVINIEPKRKITVRCKCGKVFTTRVDYLNKKQNCGCAKLRGKRYTRLYGIYMGMKSRCYNPKVWNYSNYGGRGIRICDEWTAPKTGFQKFYDWSYSNGYRDDLQIDRIDNNGNYEPSNCRWVTRSVNQFNRRHWGPKFVYKGNLMSVTNISREACVLDYTLRKKLKLLHIEAGSDITDIVDRLPKHKSLKNFPKKLTD